jgi:hypothetical protein
MLRSASLAYFSTTCLTDPELGSKRLSPEYAAFMSYVFAFEKEVVKLATLFIVVLVPNVVLPQENVTSSPSGIAP